MKKILIACGSGIATSTVANQKIGAWLNDHGFAGKFTIEQCQVSELAERSKDADFCVSTTVVDEANVHCPVYNGVQLLTGIGMDQLFQNIAKEMNR